MSKRSMIEEARRLAFHHEFHTSGRIAAAALKLADALEQAEKRPTREAVRYAIDYAVFFAMRAGDKGHWNEHRAIVNEWTKRLFPDPEKGGGDVE